MRIIHNKVMGVSREKQQTGGHWERALIYGGNLVGRDILVTIDQYRQITIDLSTDIQNVKLSGKVALLTIIKLEGCWVYEMMGY